MTVDLKKALQGLWYAASQDAQHLVFWNQRAVMTLSPLHPDALGPGVWSLGVNEREGGFTSMYMTYGCGQVVKRRIEEHLENPLEMGAHEIFTDDHCALMLRSTGKRTFTLALVDGGGWTTEFTVTPILWKKAAEKMNSIFEEVQDDGNVSSESV